MSRTEPSTAAALPSDLELHLSALLRSSDPWPAMDVAGWARGEDMLCPAAFAAWSRAALDIGKKAEGACQPVRTIALHFATFPPTADLPSIRAETVNAYLAGELGVGEPAAAAFASILDLVHLASLTRA